MWILITLFGNFLFSIVALFDKFILSKQLRHPLVYAFYTGIIEIFAVVLLPFGFDMPSWRIAIPALLSGALFIVALIFFFNAVIRFEVSKVAPIVGSMTPVAMFALTFLYKDFSLTVFQIGALAFLVIGSLLVSYRRINARDLPMLFGFSIISALFFALSYFLIKMTYEETNFVTGFVLGRMGGFMAALSILLIPSSRRIITSTAIEASRQSIALVGANKAIAALAFIAIHYATFLGDATLVQAIGGVQYVFLILLTVSLSWKFPHILQESIHFWTTARKIIATALMAFGVFILAFAGRPLDLAPGVLYFGVTFSNAYAKEIGLDWKAVYADILDDLKVKRIRLPAYWDDIEKEKGVFDFSELDWQIDEAEKRDVKIILAVGYRLPRWPECHIPQWAQNSKSRTEFEQALLNYTKQVVERYRDRYGIKNWQIENEAFLLGFGECPQFKQDLLDREIGLTRSLDVRPIVVSDSGELSMWFPAAKRADIFGTTMYRTIWDRRIGYLTYPLPPEFFHFKANIVRTFGELRSIIVTELQAEPWGPGLNYELSQEEENESFSPEKFRDNIEYAKKVGFPEVYLWGAEWWYFKKIKGDERYWEIAKEVFNQSN